jgi:hypothetical protein
MLYGTRNHEAHEGIEVHEERLHVQENPFFVPFDIIVAFVVRTCA